MEITGQFVVYCLAGLVLGFGLLRAALGVRWWLKMRGKRLVTCPETQKPAAVEVDAKRAGAQALAGTPHLGLIECSRWPEKRNCGQECLRQIESAPEGCLVRNIVNHWYEGKRCAVCGMLIHEVEWLGHKPALRDPHKKTVHWDAVAAERLPEYFTTHDPVCWNCHVAETLRREHPELVTDRPWH